jgi:3-O-methylgallate 3,4-dioxygenase
MAEIVLGLATSHSPQVSAQPDRWPDFAEDDRHVRPQYDFRGETYTYGELLKTRSAGGFAPDITPGTWERKHAACQEAIAELSRTLADAAPDVVIIIGDDQDEVLHADNRPAMLIYWGETIFGRPRVYPSHVPAGIQSAAWSYGAGSRDYPVAAGLGRFLVEQLITERFDIASSNRLPEGSAMGHAFGFVYRRLMDQQIVSTIPVMLNTYFPPNQPSPGRSYEMGQAIRRAVERWPGDERVAVVASGGLSHFAIDEDFDQMVLKAMAERDAATLAAIPRSQFLAGTSEVLNWIAASGAVEHLRMEVVDYQPCYRTEAGTGCAMAFARWA